MKNMKSYEASEKRNLSHSITNNDILLSIRFLVSSVLLFQINYRFVTVKSKNKNYVELTYHLKSTVNI